MRVLFVLSRKKILLLLLAPKKVLVGKIQVCRCSSSEDHFFLANCATTRLLFHSAVLLVWKLNLKRSIPFHSIVLLLVKKWFPFSPNQRTNERTERTELSWDFRISFFKLNSIHLYCFIRAEIGRVRSRFISPLPNRLALLLRVFDWMNLIFQITWLVICSFVRKLEPPYLFNLAFEDILSDRVSDWASCRRRQRQRQQPSLIVKLPNLFSIQLEI